MFVKHLDLISGTKKLILERLREGERDVSKLSEELGVRESAIRGHLESLEGLRLVSSHMEKGRVGRPRRLYRLSDDGLELFERRYDLLLNALLKGLKALYGEEHAENLMRGLAREVLKPVYHSSLEEALKSLVEELRALGFEPSLDGLKIKSGNCPLYKVAKAYPKIICDSFHTYMLESYLGVEVELVECMAKGANRCVHSVKKR